MPKDLCVCGVRMDSHYRRTAIDDLGHESAVCRGPREPGDRGFHPRGHVTRFSATRVQYKEVSARSDEVAHQAADKRYARPVRRPSGKGNLQLRFEDRYRPTRCDVDTKQFSSPPVVITFSVGSRAAGRRCDRQAPAVCGPIVFVDKKIRRREKTRAPGADLNHRDALLAVLLPYRHNPRAFTRWSVRFGVQHGDSASIR